MITPINIALLGVVLAAVALVVLRRRRSVTTSEVAADETIEETPATLDEPAAAPGGDVFSKHVWAESAATLTPVRADEAMTMTDADLELDDEDQSSDAEHEADDEAMADAVDLDAPEGEHDEDTGDIEGLEPEAMTDPDDGLGGIVTDPGWYLPGETDMTRGSPAAQTASLIPEDDLAVSGGLLDDEPDLVAEGPASPPLGEAANDFSAAAGWADPVVNGAEPVEPTWLGMADEEEAAAAAVEDGISFEITPSPSEDLFELPPLEQGTAEEDDQDLGGASFPLDRWQEPVTPSPPVVLGGAQTGMTAAQHGPMTVSIDPAVLVAIETEAIERSSSSGDGTMSWELTLKVELRQRRNGHDGAA